MEYTDMPANLQDEKAKRLYTALCEEYLRTHGVEEIPDSSMALLTDIATMEQIKSKLLKEIENRPMEESKRPALDPLPLIIPADYYGDSRTYYGD